jgi:hypothetical protein
MWFLPARNGLEGRPVNRENRGDLLTLLRSEWVAPEKREEMKALEIYDTLREMHMWLKPLVEAEHNEELTNAICAVDSVLYMAEGVAVQENIKEQM